MIRRHSSRLSLPWRGLVAGAVGGFVASWAMERFQARFSQTTADGLDAAQRRSGHAATWSARSQDQSDRTAAAGDGEDGRRRGGRNRRTSPLPVRAGRGWSAHALWLRDRGGGRVRRASRNTSRTDPLWRCAVRPRGLGDGGRGFGPGGRTICRTLGSPTPCALLLHAVACGIRPDDRSRAQDGSLASELSGRSAPCGVP